MYNEKMHCIKFCYIFNYCKMTNWNNLLNSPWCNSAIALSATHLLACSESLKVNGEYKKFNIVLEMYDAVKMLFFTYISYMTYLNIKILLIHSVISYLKGTIFWKAAADVLKYSITLYQGWPTRPASGAAL
jgi:hypothetical protein